MDLEKIIKEERPKISESTLKAYVSNLKKLHRLINGNNEIKSLDFLTDLNKVLDVLKKNLKSTIKNYLVAGTVILMSNPKKYKSVIEQYTEKIKQLQQNVNDKYDENEKSDVQKENWVEYGEILKLLRKLKKETKPLLEKDNLTNKEKDLIQQYLVLYLYSGKAFPVIRNDFGEMAIINEGQDMDKSKNYLVIKSKGFPYFQINEYKTAKYGGEKTIPIKDLELRKLINKWVKIANTGFLLNNITNNTPMSANGISKYLNKMFLKQLGKKISTSLLRSIYITHKYNSKMSQKEKKDLAEDMGHSKNIAEQVYNKID